MRLLQTCKVFASTTLKSHPSAACFISTQTHSTSLSDSPEPAKRRVALDKERTLRVRLTGADVHVLTSDSNTNYDEVLAEAHIETSGSVWRYHIPRRYCSLDIHSGGGVVTVDPVKEGNVVNICSGGGAVRLLGLSCRTVSVDTAGAEFSSPSVTAGAVSVRTRGGRVDLRRVIGDTVLISSREEAQATLSVPVSSREETQAFSSSAGSCERTWSLKDTQAQASAADEAAGQAEGPGRPGRAVKAKGRRDLNVGAVYANSVQLLGGTDAVVRVHSLVSSSEAPGGSAHVAASGPQGGVEIENLEGRGVSFVSSGGGGGPVTLRLGERLGRAVVASEGGSLTLTKPAPGKFTTPLSFWEKVPRQGPDNNSSSPSSGDSDSSNVGATAQTSVSRLLASHNEDLAVEDPSQLWQAVVSSQQWERLDEKPPPSAAGAAQPEEPPTGDAHGVSVAGQPPLASRLQMARDSSLMDRLPEGLVLLDAAGGKVTLGELSWVDLMKRKVEAAVEEKQRREQQSR